MPVSDGCDVVDGPGRNYATAARLAANGLRQDGNHTAGRQKMIIEAMGRIADGPLKPSELVVSQTIALW